MQNTKKVFIGVLIGGLAGAATILLVAAQSAVQARAKIRRQGIRWRDRAAGIAEHAPAPVRHAAGGRTAGNMTVHLA
ncbi:MAG: hypothetical protein JW748_13630 [Anaerolineales bacterium]|nr:hypothetical protein [Anaerolineales bacterium]